MQNNSKANTVLLSLILIVVIGVALFMVLGKKNTTDIPANITTEGEDLRWVKISRDKYSFDAPDSWVISEPLNVDGCLWDTISIPSDGHQMKGEISIYPKACFDISKHNFKEYAEKDGYYIVAHYGDTEPYMQTTKTAYEKVVETFTLSPQTTSVYKNHGFTMELPAGYTPVEMQAEGGPAMSISLPNNSHMTYVTNASWWEQYNIPSYTFVRSERIGATSFKVYTYNNMTFYWFRQGNVGYEFSGDIELLKTFKFVGWAQ
jgi:hypothetical protein